MEAFSLSLLGIFTCSQGNVEEGVPLLEESLNLDRALGDKYGQENTLRRLAGTGNDLEYRTTLAKEGLRLGRELGDLAGIASSLINLARLKMWSGDFSSSAPWLEEALLIVRQVGNKISEMAVLTNYGNLAYWQGNYQQAIIYHQDALKLNEIIGAQYDALWTEVFLAYAVLRQGDVQQARELFENSIRRTQKAGVVIALIFAIEGLASLNVIHGKAERVAQLFAWADAMRDQMGDHRPPMEQASVEKDLAVIHSKLDDAEFARLSAEGRTMTEEQAIALALEV
jgi:tetratricopeptide (TPR) repeat protein